MGQNNFSRIALLSALVVGISTIIVTIISLTLDQNNRINAQSIQETQSTITPTAQNGLIAFGREGHIFTMKMDGSEVTQLPTIGDSSDPMWSPDGQRLAFVSGQNDRRYIYIMEADGSGITRLTTEGNSYAPGWSPDGQWITFASDRNGGSEIYTMRIDGSGITRLTTEGNSSAPKWSPDGQWIAFLWHAVGYTYDIYLMKPDGSGLTRLTTEGSSYAPGWSPDSRQIVFGGIRIEESGGIYTMRIDESEAHLLRQGVGINPEWSPDGQWIVFRSGGGGKDYIDIMMADGSQEVRLTLGDSFTAPSWQPIPWYITLTPTSNP